MSNTQNVRMMTRYNAWANRVIFDAVAALPAEEPIKTRASLFPTMVHTLNHLHVVDLIWRAHLEGHAHGIPALNTMLYPDLADLWSAQQKIDDWYIAWGDALTEVQSEKRIAFTLIGGNKGEMRCCDVITHVVNHTSYHRGFVCDMFFQVPVKAPTTDLPVFLRTVGMPA